MKKPKTKLSGDAIKQMLVKHVEKIGLGAAFVVLGLLVLGAMRRETISPDKTPDKLVAMVGDINQRIQSTPHGGIPAPKYDLPNPSMAQRTDPKIKDQIEATPPWTPANPPVKDLSPRRSNVAIFPVIDLRTFADRGPIAMKKVNVAPGPNPTPPGGQKGPVPPAGPVGAIVPQGRRFVMITGLIPTLKQQSEFDTRFKDAMQPTAADDLFAGNAAAEPGKEKTSGLDRFHPKYWTYSLQRREVLPDGTFGKEVVVDNATLTADRKGWANSTNEICDPDFLDPRLTSPLPPLLLRNWDERVGHLPEIPLKADKPAGVQPAPTSDDPGVRSDDPFATNGPAKPAVAVAAEKIISHKLFRIWDYDVQPNTSYQYRVQVSVINPNYQLHSRILETPELAKETLLRSAWSVWSPTATIPRDHQLLAAGVEYKSDLKEPYAKVVCWSWSHENAVEVHHRFEMFRGEMAGDPAKFTQTVEAANPAGGGKITLKEFAFRPNMILVDFSGGVQGPRPPNPIPTADLVFLDAATNQLVLRRQAMDQVKVESLEQQRKDEETPGGMMLPGMDRMPGNPKGPDKGKSGLPNILLDPPGGAVDKATSKGTSPKKN